VDSFEDPKKLSLTGGTMRSPYACKRFHATIIYAFSKGNKYDEKRLENWNWGRA
jgi:hypothetical protein